MTEERIAHLYQISSNVFDSQNTGELLKSYYLMRCHDLTHSYGLPSKQFSPLSQCSFCCTEWKNGNYETEVKPVKLSKGQRRRIRKAKEICNLKDSTRKQKASLHCNSLERKCLFCNHVTKIPLEKPDKTAYLKKTENMTETKAQTTNIIKDKRNKNNMKNKQQSKEKNKVLQNIKQKEEINVYSKTNDVFSLANKRNDIAVKLPEKVIKNNKKKKDKFAGLCKEAVIAAAKIAVAKQNQNQEKNKLNLFLKPSKQNK